jgi:hypothetical protein
MFEKPTLMSFRVDQIPLSQGSLLEEAGFEPSVPRDTTKVSRAAHVASA